MITLHCVYSKICFFHLLAALVTVTASFRQGSINPSHLALEKKDHNILTEF